MGPKYPLTTPCPLPSGHIENLTRAATERWEPSQIQMYSVFSIGSPPSVGPERGRDDDERSPPYKMPRPDEPQSGKLTRSCAECRRRRIRCDSTGPPCGQCTWYKVADLCRYPTRRRRNVPSQQYSSGPRFFLH
jgi:hypothetical protein